MSFGRGNTGGFMYYMTPPPLPLLCLGAVMMFLLFIWGCAAYESVMETVTEQMNVLVMICPLFLLILLHWLSVSQKPTIPLPGSNPGDIHKAGGSPWGVALLLVLLILMISYQSTFHDSWFPFFSRG